MDNNQTIEDLQRQLDEARKEYKSLSLKHDGEIPNGNWLHGRILRLSGQIRRARARQRLTTE